MRHHLLWTAVLYYYNSIILWDFSSFKPHLVTFIKEGNVTGVTIMRATNQGKALKCHFTGGIGKIWKSKKISIKSFVSAGQKGKAKPPHMTANELQEGLADAGASFHCATLMHKQNPHGGDVRRKPFLRLHHKGQRLKFTNILKLNLSSLATSDTGVSDKKRTVCM